MKKIVLTKGLPASGKTTWAKQFIKDNQGWKRINKDDLRAMLDDGKWSGGNEKFILAARDLLVKEALARGHNVIIDDTNLSPKHELHLKELVGNEVMIEIKDFTDVSVEECIERDRKRPNYVGEKVIRQMYNQFLRPAPVKTEWTEGLPNAVICDLDGTLALFGDANPYERDFLKDEVNEAIRDILIRLFQGQETKIILLSGRMDKFREQTVQWLANKQVSYHNIFMRKTDDMRKDFIIKEELYNEQIKGKYNIIAVIDDRLQVCRLWYRLGLPLLKVGDPDADF